MNTRFAPRQRKADPYAAIQRWSRNVWDNGVPLLDRQGHQSTEWSATTYRTGGGLVVARGGAGVEEATGMNQPIVVVTNQGCGCQIDGAVDVVVYISTSNSFASDGVLMMDFRICPHHRSQRCGAADR